MDALTQGTDAEQSLDETAQRGAKRRRVVPPELLSAWRKLHARTQAAQRLLARAPGASDDAGNDAGSKVAAAPVFAFVEGALVSALRNGSWLLLDEINLAPVETLERLVSIIEVRHTCLHASPNFRRLGGTRDTFEPSAAIAVPRPGRVLSRTADWVATHRHSEETHLIEAAFSVPKSYD